MKDLPPDTPETNSTVICLHSKEWKPFGGIVVSDVCRRFERERNKLSEALQSVMDWNPKPEYWERPEAVARFEADMARAREVLRETRPIPNN